MSTAERLRREGRAEGLAAGKAEGIAEGRIETLLRLIAKRFGPPTSAAVDRIRSATTADLDRWTERFLDAKSLAELFAG